MKYGQLTAKYNSDHLKSFGGTYIFPNRHACRSRLQEVFKIMLYKRSIIIKAYDEPGPDRIKVIVHHESFFSGGWRVLFDGRVSAHTISSETLDALNIVPAEDTYFYIEIWQ